MSDRIAVMRAGRIVQVGTSADLYERPADTFVARFLGESNLLPGRVLESRCGTRATLAVEGLPAPVEGRAGPNLRAGTAAAALIRPEHVRPRTGGHPARIVERVFIGEIVAMRLALDGGPELWARCFGSDAPSAERVEVGWDPAHVSILAEPPSTTTESESGEARC